MAQELTNTGISVVGNMPWGTHFCSFYETKQDLLDILVPYFKAGLESKEFCVWVISNSDLFAVEEAKAALAAAVPDLDRQLLDGNIEIFSGLDWYLEGDVFNLEKVMRAWDSRLKRALARGYVGMRVSGDTFWLTEKDWNDFFAYEKQLNESITDQPMTLLCTYPLAKSGASEVLDVVHAHQFVIARRRGEWEVVESPESIQGKQEIRKLNEELEQRVVEQTKELRDANQELRREITERKQAEEALDERLRFETLLTELSAAFANLSPNEVDREIDKWLQTLVEFLGVDRASFFQFGEDWTTLYRSHSYTVPGIEPLPPPPIGMKEQFPWITDQLRRGITVKWTRIPDDMPEEAAREKEYAAKVGVKSGLNIPVRMGGSVICAMTFTSMATYRDWPDDMVARLRLVGEIFAAAIERKRAEAALRESEERFRQMAENIREVFWLCAGDLSKTLYISPAYEVVWGRSRESLYQDLRSVFAAIHPDDRNRAVTTIETEREQGFELEYRVVRPDGSIRWIRDRGFPIKDESGRFYRVAGIAEDITERKQAEDALRRSEDRLRLVIDTVPALIHTGLPDGQLDFFNQRWLDFVGLSLPDLSGWKWTAVIHPEDLAAMVERWRAALGTGEPYEHEARVRRADGEYHWMVHREVPLRNERGNIVKWYASSIDIEDRKRAEDALRQSEDRLRLVIDTIPVMAWSIQPDGVVDFLNQRWVDYFGLSLQQYVADPTSPVHPEDLPRVMEEWRKNMAAGTSNEGEIRLRRADGEYRWFLVRNAPLRDDQGNIVKWYGASIDIEDRKQAEEKLKHNEFQFAQAQRLAHVGSWDWDIRTNVVTWSDELYRIFGLQPGTIKAGGEARQFIHPEDQDLVSSTVERSVINKELYSFYYRILRPDGEERVVHSRGHVMSDENGNPIRVFGATQDVTELKHQEEKLKATTERLRALSASVQSDREEESKRIAREIHDELGGALTIWKWDLEEIRDEMSTPLDASEVATVHSKIEGMIKLTETTLDTVRRLASELRPAALELGLVQGLEWQVLQFENRTGIPIQLECDVEKVDLDNGQATAVFRILQEALTNILRHAEATGVTIAMKQEAGEFRLTIRDNGRGITESEKSGARSLGLLGMRERALLIGAKIDITAEKGNGTLVSLSVPISTVESE